MAVVMVCCCTLSTACAGGSVAGDAGLGAGPLGDEGRGRIEVPVPGRGPATHGLVLVQNRGRLPASITHVRLLGAVGARLIGVRLRLLGQPPPSTTTALTHWPPTELPTVAADSPIPPSAAAPAGAGSPYRPSAELLLGIAFARAGRFSGVEVDYVVGDRRYRFRSQWGGRFCRPPAGVVTC